MISNVSGSTSYILNAGFPPFISLVSQDWANEITNNELLGVRAGESEANPTAVAAF